MVAGAKGRSTEILCHHSADRHTAAQSLSQCDHIGLDPEMLVSKKCSRTANAGLHLIHHHEDIQLRTKLPEFLHECGIRGNHAALSLYRLYQNSAGLFLACQRANGFDIVVFRIDDLWQHGAQPFLILGLSRSRDRTEGSAVERVFHRDDLALLRATHLTAILSGQFQRRLRRFRTAITEKHLIRAASLHQCFRQLHLWLDPVQIRGVKHFLHLCI